MLCLVSLSAFLALPATGPTDRTTQAWNILREGASDENLLKRKQAISALGYAGADPQAITILHTALEDKDPDIRQAAAAALGEMKSRTSIARLRKALDDEVPEVSFTAARSLWQMGDRSGRDLLLAVLAGERADSSGVLKTSMRDAKRRLKNPTSLAMIGVKEGAGIFLGPFAMGITVFEELMKDGSASARAVSIALFSMDTDPSTILALEEALYDKNWVVRAAAAKALATRRATRSLPSLETMLTDKNDGAKFAAASAIIRLSPRQAPRPATANAAAK